MNPELETEKNVIAQSYQQQVTSALIAELAQARVELRKLKAEIAAAKPTESKAKK